jgi:hypothetical protein
MAPILGIWASGATASRQNSYESIATVAGTGSASILSLTSIPSTYQHLQIRGTILTAAGGGGLSLNFNSDGGSNYASHRVAGNGTSANAGAQTSLTYLQYFGFGQSTSTTNPTAFVMDILDYASTSKYKTVRILLGQDANGSGEVGLYSGLWMSTSALNRIDFNCGQNYTTTSSFSLYGIKG